MDIDPSDLFWALAGHLHYRNQVRNHKRNYHATMMFSVLVSRNLPVWASGHDCILDPKFVSPCGYQGKLPRL